MSPFAGCPSHLLVLGGAARRGSAQASGLPVASSQGAASNLTSITGGAAVGGCFHAHLLSTIHLRQPGCKYTEVHR